MNIKKVDKLAQQWVEAHSHKWSNNNNEVGDNYGSFVEGYKAAEKELQTEISDEEIYKASHQEINHGGGSEGWIKAAFRQGAVWYREQLKKK